MSLKRDALVILRDARALITRRERWTQNSYARAASGRPVNTSDVDAHCFCALGAIKKVGGVKEARYVAQEMMTNETDDQGIIWFNDSHTHEEVLALFDKVIGGQEKTS